MADETKFTPGPWSATPLVPGAQRAFAITGNLAAHNRAVDIGTIQGGYYSCKANAHLIAAAPDLYEALTWALAHIEGRTRTTEEQFEACVKRTHAALAKASTPAASQQEKR